MNQNNSQPSQTGMQSQAQSSSVGGANQNKAYQDIMGGAQQSATSMPSTPTPQQAPSMTPQQSNPGASGMMSSPIPGGSNQAWQAANQPKYPPQTQQGMTNQTNLNTLANNIRNQKYTNSSNTTPSNTTTSSTQSENSTLLRFIPTIDEINRMRREELMALKDYLVNHCLDEAIQLPEKTNVKAFARESIRKWSNVPALIDMFYPKFITDDIQNTYNNIIEYSKTDENTMDTSAIVNLKYTVKNSLDYTMKLINQSSDWISIVLSRELTDLSVMFNNTKFSTLTVGKFLSIAALCASVIYIMTKLFKSSFNNSNAYSECVKAFNLMYTNNLSNFKEGIDDKLKEYMDKEVPSNIIMLNSLITKAYPLAKGILFSISFDDKGEYGGIPVNTLILTEICASIVILWRESIGKKFKSMTKNGRIKNFISKSLLSKMEIDPASMSPSKDIFTKLNGFKNTTLNSGDL